MNIGLVSTRFAGLDGVSLETAKVADALGDAGHTFAWYAGELWSGFAPGMVEPEAHFATAENEAIQAAAFHGGDPDTTLLEIDATAARLRVSLDRFVESYAVEALLIENALAIPMQLPLAVALTRLLAETGIPAVAHHHDFAWERARFDHCTVPRILQEFFPPSLENLSHVVINTDARDDLFRRRGIESLVVPNVMDFERGPGNTGDGSRFRHRAGLTDRDIVLLQPTRIIERKGIEYTIELAARLSDPTVSVVITHGGDVDITYWEGLQRLAADLDVDLRLVPAGLERSALGDAYAGADLVCFPSLYEGFGNALLEAFFYRRPVFVNRYPVYRRDIAPTGVRCIEIDGELTEGAVAAAARWLADPAAAESAIETNYQIGVEHFSYRVARDVFGEAFGNVVSRR